MLLAAIIYQVRLHGNLLIGLKKDVSPELSNGLDACSRVLDLCWKPLFVMSNAFHNPWGKSSLTRRIRDPMDTYSLAICFARELEEVIYDMAIIEIVRIAHKRMRKVMCYRFEDLILHVRWRYKADALHWPGDNGASGKLSMRGALIPVR